MYVFIVVALMFVFPLVSIVAQITLASHGATRRRRFSESMALTR